MEYVFQYCLTGGFALGCKGQLNVNIGSIRPYSMCCRSDFCNSEEELLRLMEDYNSQLPSQSQSQSHSSTNGLTSSTLIYNSTLATQMITATISYSSNVKSSSSLSTASSFSYIATTIVSTHTPVSTSSFVSYSTTHIVNSGWFSVYNHLLLYCMI